MKHPYLHPFYFLLTIGLLLGLMTPLPTKGAGGPEGERPPATAIPKDKEEPIDIQANEIVIYPTLNPAAGGCSSYWYAFFDSNYSAWLTLNAQNGSQSTNSGVWRPNLPQTGTYKVEAYIASHNQTSSCGLTYNYDTSQARYVIQHANGATTVTGNQQPVWSGWINLGDYQFNAGTGGYVTLSDLTGETYLSRAVSFSAMRFTLNSNPVLQVNPTSLNFSATQGGSNPTAQSFTISNSGTGALNWTASDNATWLALSSTSGSAPATVNATVNISGLSAGTYNGTITVSSAGVSGSPKTIGVVLVVNPVNNAGMIDLTISLHKSANTDPERAPYERILEFFADAVYEMSNGAHRVRNVIVYTNGGNRDTANIVWNSSEWPRAHVSGYGWGHVWMGDSFPFNNPYNALSQTNWRGAGYTLGHEWGHYYYSIYDEYQLQSGDVPVQNSVMNSQWNAVGGNFNWLNFSIARNNTGRTEQHRNYGASGWETLARPISQDPRDGNRSALPTRLYYAELAGVAPGVGQDSPLELPNAQGQARSQLRINWQSGTVQNSSVYNANIISISGREITYPQPVILVATVSQLDLIAKANLETTVKTPDGGTISLNLTDNGVAPDVLANDGLYSGLMPYTQGGNYDITTIFSNPSGQAEFSKLSYSFSPGPDGETYHNVAHAPSPPVDQNLYGMANTTVTINNFKTDDHGNTVQSATLLPTNNVDLAGRIDRAGDKDMFKIIAYETGQLILRVTDLAFDMHPKIRVLGANGSTVLGEFDFVPEGNNYFFTSLDVQAGQIFYAEISHFYSSAATGNYAVSVGQALTSGGESENNTIYLPFIIK